jgi:hypothetical protein
VSSTRQQLRQEIGRLTGDMLKLTATATGTTTTLIDKLRLGGRGNGSLEGRIGWMASGTAANLYQMVRVTGNVASTWTVTFADTALTSATATADVMELWNERGVGWYPDEVNDAINRAIANVEGLVTTPVTETPVTFDVGNPYLDIPESWQFFGGARYEKLNSDDNGVWYEIDPDMLVINDVARTVRIKQPMASTIDTLRVELYGDTPSSTLTSDQESTNVNARWLTADVAWQLMLPALRRTTGTDSEISTKMAFCKQVATEERGRARTRPSGMAKRLY